MIQRHPGRDAPPQQGVDQFVVELDALLAYGVVSAAQRNDARPGQGEAVSFGAVLCQEVKVLFISVVVVTRNVSVSALGPGRLEMAVRVPDGFAAAAFGHGSLDLVGRSCESPFKING